MVYITGFVLWAAFVKGVLSVFQMVSEYDYDTLDSIVDNNRRLDDGSYYTVENGTVVRHERLKLVKG